MSNECALSYVRAVNYTFELDHVMVKVIEVLARDLMRLLCPFEGVSGDFDRCSNLTRQKYEGMAAKMFGFTCQQYYDAASLYSHEDVELYTS